MDEESRRERAAREHHICLRKGRRNRRTPENPRLKPARSSRRLAPRSPKESPSSSGPAADQKLGGGKQDQPSEASTRTFDPEGTFLNTLASPETRPMTLTALAGRTSFPRLMGVGPKKIQKASPEGQ